MVRELAIEFIAARTWRMEPDRESASNSAALVEHRTDTAKRFAVLSGALALAMVVILSWLFSARIVRSREWWSGLLSILLLLSALWLLICPFLFALARSRRKKYVAGIQSLLDGQRWTYWQYNTEEWSQFAEREWARARREALRMPFYIAAVLAVVLSLSFLLGSHWKTGLAMGLLGGFGLGLIAAPAFYLLARSTYQRRRKAVGEAYIGPRSLYFDGSYYAWGEHSISVKVSLEPGPPAVLLFVIQYADPETSNDEVRVPVPAGRENEARKLAERFSTAGRSRTSASPPASQSEQAERSP